uniref:PI-PLC Y-box domain-containing protein n=1 Tax=Globodera pallida TaxID=36090 RepID=A0A183CH21_GLOPA
MNGTGLFAECAKVMGREGWHALIIGKMTNGLLEKDLQTGLHLGAFMDDFDGMSLRVLALDLVLFTKQNGTEWCKKKCFSLSYGLDPTPFNTPDAQNAVTEQSRLTTAYSRLLTGTPTSKLKPTASNKDHFGTSCTEIIFPTDVPKFMLNISASPYQIGCADYEKHYAMNETPPPEHIGVHVCYKSSRKGPGNSSIAELCRKHLGVDSNFAGFAVQICVHREEQMLVVESFVNLSFSNKTFKRLRNFSFSLDEISSAMETIPILFIEFGNGHHQRAIRNESGKEIVSGFKWNNENDGIGAVLNDIAPEKINESWAKKVHFVPPSTDRMRVFFQIANPEFSKLITNRTKVKPYENNPNKTNPTLCDEYGDDCEPIRELLHKIENLSKCNQPKGGPIETPDSSPFKVPSWVDKPPIGHPPKASITLLCDGDLFCNKDELQKQYDEKRRSCGLKPEADGRRQKRQYRLSNATIGKWTEFPILIGFSNKL